MSPGAPEKLGAPGLLETLALYSFIYDFWKCRSGKNWKGVFFQIELTAKEWIFGAEIDENEIQNCKSLEHNA